MGDTWAWAVAIVGVSFFSMITFSYIYGHKGADVVCIEMRGKWSHLARTCVFDEPCECKVCDKK